MTNVTYIDITKNKKFSKDVRSEDKVLKACEK